MNELDRQLFLWLNAGASTPEWLIALARFCSSTAPALLVACLIAVAVLGRRNAQLVLDALALAALAWVLVSLVRAVLPMPRPVELGLGLQWLSQSTHPGFPSRHAATAFALAFALLLRRWPGMTAAALLLALATGWSRLFLGLHFPSDVAAGALLGGLVAWAGTSWLVRRDAAVAAAISRH